MSARIRIKTVQAICWIGVAADALWAVALAFPQLYGVLLGRPDLQIDLSMRLAMGVGASLMMGWTALLAWTARNPVERRAVMLFTAFPVLTGLITVAILGFVNGNPANLWILVKCAILFFAMLAGFHWAKPTIQEAADEIDN